MRLIDADELNEVLNWTRFKPPYSKRQVRRFIEMARTVEAEPVRHGHWIIKDDWCTCSVCRESMHYNNGLNEKPSIINAMSMIVHYCPSCGAKMDQRKEDENE